MIKLPLNSLQINHCLMCKRKNSRRQHYVFHLRVYFTLFCGKRCSTPNA